MKARLERSTLRAGVENGRARPFERLKWEIPGETALPHLLQGIDVLSPGSMIDAGMGRGHAEITDPGGGEMTTKRRSNRDKIHQLPGFPKVVNLKDGTQATLRPMMRADGRKLLEFFLRVPEEDRRYLRDDVASPELIDAWARELDYARVMPILAVIAGKVVADASLHWGNTWGDRPEMAHAGDVRVVVDPAFRSMGLANLMIQELIAIAREAKLERLFFHLAIGGEAAAIRAAERLGFVGVAAVFRQHRDKQGKPFDLLVMELPLNS